MQREFLMNFVEPENLVRDDVDCKEYLLEAMKYHLMPEYRSSFISARTKERNPDGMLPYIFAVGNVQAFYLLNAVVVLENRLHL